MKKTVWLFLIFLSPLAIAQELLQKSTVLDSLSAFLFICEVKEGRILLEPIKTQNAGEKANLDSEEKALLANNGKIYPLEGSLSEASSYHLDWCCGGLCPEPAAALSFRKHLQDFPTGEFVFLGKDIAKHIRWNAARLLGPLKKIKSKDGAFDLRKSGQYKINGIAGKLVWTSWKRIAGKNTSGVDRKDIIELVSDKGERSVLNESLFYPSGEAHERSIPLSNPVGLLKISDGTRNESWLIFQSHNYEASGVVAFPIDSGLRLDPERAETSYYSGC